MYSTALLVIMSSKINVFIKNTLTKKYDNINFFNDFKNALSISLKRNNYLIVVYKILLSIKSFRKTFIIEITLILLFFLKSYFKITLILLSKRKQLRFTF